jgi:hypothetical protein
MAGYTSLPKLDASTLARERQNSDFAVQNSLSFKINRTNVFPVVLHECETWSFHEGRNIGRECARIVC